MAPSSVAWASSLSLYLEKSMLKDEVMLFQALEPMVTASNVDIESCLRHPLSRDAWLVWQWQRHSLAQCNVAYSTEPLPSIVDCPCCYLYSNLIYPSHLPLIATKLKSNCYINATPATTAAAEIPVQHEQQALSRSSWQPTTLLLPKPT